MWLAGWTLVAVRLAMNGSGHAASALDQTIALNCMVLGPLMFLGSLASQYLVQRPRILFTVAFGIPLFLFATTVAVDPRPGPLVHIFLLLCTLAALIVGAAWGLRRNFVPTWLSLLLVFGFGGACIWLTLRGQSLCALRLVTSGILAMAALLFVFAFRRVTAGSALTVGGLSVWALAVIQSFSVGPHLPVDLLRAVDLLKVFTALGMVVLVLEDEIAANRAAQLSDRRARGEMEHYTRLYLGAMPYEISNQEYDGTCRAIAEASRFAQAAIFLRNAGGTFRLAGQAGLSSEQIAVFDAVACRATDRKIEELSAPEHAALEIGQVARVDISSLLLPGEEDLPEDLRRPRVIGIRGRDPGLQGTLALAGLRDPDEPLRTQDVLPLELLVARIGAARENAALLRRLMQSERLAGLGQLASGVAHELNNPLTAVTGFAELLTEVEDPSVRDRAGVILNEARRMKKIIESLVRFRKLSVATRAPVSVELLLRDIEKLARHDMESARVQFRMSAAPGLPRAMGDGEQIRQVFLQLVRNSIISFDETQPEEPRWLNVEMDKIDSIVRTVFTDNGPGFADPARAFDPFFITRQPGGGMGLGLSLCYSIIHEQGGEITAENLAPRGARIVVELPAEEKSAAAGHGASEDSALAPAM